MIVLAAILGGIVPMLIYPLFFYWMDRYEKEPMGLLTGAFLWGFAPAALLSLISQLIFGIPFLLIDDSGALADLIGTAILAPITEEFFKGLAVLLIFLLWRNEFDGVFDGIVYGSLVGFGFAAIENVLYFISYGPSLIFTRAFLFGLNHALFTSMTGIGFGIARHARSSFVRLTAPLAGLIAAMVLHGIHNITLTLAEQAPALICLAFLADYGGLLFLLVVMILAIRRERQWIIEHLKDEIEQKTLTQSQYEVVCSPTRRFSARLAALLSGGPTAWWRMGRYFHALTELAYRKHAQARRGEAGAEQTLIDTLRAQAAAASAEMIGITP